MVNPPALRHHHSMNTALLFVASITLATIGVGGVVAFFAIRSARDGYEDEHGFHATPAPEPVRSASVVISHEGISLPA